jgi:hypothetical protein
LRVGVEPGLDSQSEFPGYRKSEEETHSATHPLPDLEGMRLLGEFSGCIDAKERNSNRRKGNKKHRGEPRSRIPKHERKKKKGSPCTSTDSEHVEVTSGNFVKCYWEVKDKAGAEQKTQGDGRGKQT